MEQERLDAVRGLQDVGILALCLVVTLPFFARHSTASLSSRSAGTATVALNTLGLATNLSFFVARIPRGCWHRHAPDTPEQPAPERLHKPGGPPVAQEEDVRAAVPSSIWEPTPVPRKPRPAQPHFRHAIPALEKKPSGLNPPTPSLPALPTPLHHDPTPASSSPPRFVTLLQPPTPDLSWLSVDYCSLDVDSPAWLVPPRAPWTVAGPAAAPAPAPAAGNGNNTNTSRDTSWLSSATLEFGLRLSDAPPDFRVPKSPSSTVGFASPMEPMARTPAPTTERAKEER
ncbi:MAG: hypothetical protein M1826_002712 [Phylliscum demangeonii]|nr:MAG: hypothetical protein M1826_002712 [Phylliscum demangeonii]